MFDYEKIAEELDSYLEGWNQYYDTGNIMEEIRNYHYANIENGDEPINSLDDIDPDDFQDMLKRNDRSEM